MKKNNLFKILMICLFSYVLLTWLIPTGSYSDGTFALGSRVPLGLFDLFREPLKLIANFIHYAMIILAIGGFYSVLNRTGVYSKMIDSITKKFKGLENLYLGITIALVAILSSFFGLNFVFFALMPFTIAVLMSMKFSKKNALLASVGPIFIGTIASMYSIEVNGYQKYFLGIEYGQNLLVKIIFLLLLIALLIFFIIKNQKGIKKASKEEIPMLEKEEGKKAENKKKKVLPLVIIFALSFVLLLLGSFNWSYTFNVTAFDSLQTSISNLQIGDFSIITNLLGSVTALGTWDLYFIVIIFLMASFVIGWIYSLKLDDILDALLEGNKKMAKPAFYVLLAGIVMIPILTASTNITTTITNAILGLSKGFNIITAFLSGIVSSLFYNDYTQGLYMAVDSIKAHITNTEMIPLTAFIYQVVQGVSYFILPTSALLLGGLVYLDIPFKEWVKYIWKFVLAILGLGIFIAIIIGIFV